MTARAFYWCRACRRPLFAASSAVAGTARDWEIDHQEPGDCANDALFPLAGTAAAPEELRHAAGVLRLFGH
ncbi:hypothetical protein AMK16_20180 [Streptomyces sp. CB00455]|uniref:hypothetical protein n=1 Tax=Streptomyces sp. CB00455 TaxID=1703927 RepID=UPI00093DE19B|nr:hypothetical protein [Streptomyces sp. CB00455]OKK17216.1 hypothetical protein AMK16_20180 [Streptomyces sp. CB00455]